MLTLWNTRIRAHPRRTAASTQCVMNVCMTQRQMSVQAFPDFSLFRVPVSLDFPCVHSCARASSAFLNCWQPEFRCRRAGEQDRMAWHRRRSNSVSMAQGEGWGARVGHSLSLFLCVDLLICMFIYCRGWRCSTVDVDIVQFWGEGRKQLQQNNNSNSHQVV